jgi:hypothetical protein
MPTHRRPSHGSLRNALQQLGGQTTPNRRRRDSKLVDCGRLIHDTSNKLRGHRLHDIVFARVAAHVVQELADIVHTALIQSKAKVKTSVIGQDTRSAGPIAPLMARLAQEKKEGESQRSGLPTHRVSYAAFPK